MSVDNVLSMMNPEQYRAATSTSDHILVLAGAGSGKTSVLTSRIGHLQVNERIGTVNMLCLTFTRLAAAEMKNRVSKLIGDELAKKLVCGTFHSFCVKVLHEYGYCIGIYRDFSLIDEEDKQALIESIINDLRFKQVRPSQIHPWDDRNAMKEDVRAVVEEYHYRLRANNATDLDGLLMLTIRILENNVVADEYRNRFMHVFVDEYQDTDDRQEKILNLINPHNLFVVGDPSQAIYEWRGARIENILTFEKRFPGCEVVRLERNYRSNEKILEIANKTIAGTEQALQLTTDKEAIDPPRLIHFPNSDVEISDMSRNIKDIIDAGHLPNEIAVLCRTNNQVETIHKSLESIGVPVLVVNNRMDPLNATDIRREIDFMAVLCNGQDERALRRIINFPERRISDMELLKAEPEEITSMSLPQLSGLKELVTGIRDYSPVWSSALTMFCEIESRLDLGESYKKFGLKNRLEQMESSVKAIMRWENKQTELGEPTDPYSFLRWRQTRDIQDKLAQDDNGGVRLMTVHAAKGLEWDTVFIVGCNDGVFPSKRSDEEEERRLFYVAVTRARDNLTLSYADERFEYGKVNFNPPSRFLQGAGFNV